MRIMETELPRAGPYTRRGKTTAVVPYHAEASSATNIALQQTQALGYNIPSGAQTVGCRGRRQGDGSFVLPVLILGKIIEPPLWLQSMPDMISSKYNPKRLVMEIVLS